MESVWVDILVPVHPLLPLVLQSAVISVRVRLQEVSRALCSHPLAAVPESEGENSAADVSDGVIGLCSAPSSCFHTHLVWSRLLNLGLNPIYRRKSSPGPKDQDLGGSSGRQPSHEEELQEVEHELSDQHDGNFTKPISATHLVGCHGDTPRTHRPAVRDGFCHLISN